MRTWFSEDHRLHFPQGELSGGELVTPYERPSRVEYVLRRLGERGFAAPTPPGDADMGPIRAVHCGDYLGFLETAWDEWVAAGFRGEAIAGNYPARRMQTARVPRHIDGKVGYYALASETAITAGTWRAALSAAASAEAAARDVADGAAAAFALCRPPGHHASRDQFGGYCFLNNAAIAAEVLRAAGANRVAILDIDFHHGNGTQDVFWERGDVFFASLHGAPEEAFPYFLGYVDETGAGAGAGATANFPLPPGTPWGPWAAALDDALARTATFGAEALVVSLGVDAYEADPISFFKLTSDDFTRAGARIAAADLPTVFCLEGGYAIEAVGVNVVNVLEGFADGRRRPRSG
jgi:acetoin utilization deacetylase AcuC-like enzyme